MRSNPKNFDIILSPIQKKGSLHLQAIGGTKYILLILIYDSLTRISYLLLLLT